VFGVDPKNLQAFPIFLQTGIRALARAHRRKRGC
jgi:hypothetical protein